MSRRKKNKDKPRPPIYGNFTCLGPDGAPLFRCDRRKYEWYIKQNLAIKIDNETFLLIFKPGGNGHRDEPDLLKSRENICVVCGTKEGLSRHHVVPSRYRKLFPEQEKKHNFHDVLPLCEPCHRKYESLAYKFTKQLEGPGISREQHKAESAAVSILSYAPMIPQERLDRMNSDVAIYLDRDFSWEDLIRLENERTERVKGGRWKKVVEQLFPGAQGMASLIQAWRKHFVDTMKPKFLPPGWRIDRPTRDSSDRREFP